MAFVTHAGVSMPRLVYGTAWKKERTTQLVLQALEAGFRGIDTACQPKHYREDLVGEALAQVLSPAGPLKREEVFVQTKYTPIGGQDTTQRAGPLPYDPKAPLAQQVEQSVQTSLRNLHVSYIDSLVLHSPLPTHAQTMTAWRAMEQAHANGQVRQLGISNIYDPQALVQLWDDAKVKPAVVQNRFYDDSGYDVKIRAFCAKNTIAYQSFWTLTANPHLLESKLIGQVANKAGKTRAQTLFRFLMELGVVPLTGTTSKEHMKQDLEVVGWVDGPTEAEVKEFRVLVGEA